MGGGNGAKSAMKRERNAAAAAKGQAKSQLKVNEAAKNIQCFICKQTFLSTSRKLALEQHRESKHSAKTLKDCFPTFDDTA